MEGGPGRLDSVTALRFFAAALVLGHHLSAHLLRNTIVFPLLSPGFTGVTFFFVLSGFILSWTFSEGLPRSKFYGRRFARVYPLHLCTALIAFILLMAWNEPPGLLPSVMNLTLLQGWIPAEQFTGSLNWVSWSLSCEAFFYLCFPFLYRYLRGSNILRIAIFVSISMVLIAVALNVLLPNKIADQILYFNPAYRMGEFTLGILLAIAMKRGWKPKFSLLAALAIWIVCYVSAFAFSKGLQHILGDSSQVLPVYANLITIPGVICVLAAAANADNMRLRSPLRHPILIKLGEASFALYLIHLLIIITWLDHLFGVPRSTPERFAVGALLAVLSIAASLFLHRWVEAPAERVLRRRIGTP